MPQKTAMTDAKVGIENPKNVGNVGNVLRACGCFAASDVYYTGNRYDRANRFADAASKHLGEVALSKVETLITASPAAYTKVGVELVVGAIPLTEYQHPEFAYYIFGPEDASLDQATIDACDEVIYIPAAHCLNLAASVNVVLYDRALKANTFQPSDDLVKNSRDNRNRLRVNHHKNFLKNEAK